MSRYNTPVVWTVQLVLPMTGNQSNDVSFDFPGDEHGQEQARQLFKELTKTRGVLRSHDDRYTQGVNLIAWDKHPSHDDATGMIIGQEGWVEG